MRRATIFGLVLLLSLFAGACGEPSNEGGGDSGAPAPAESPDPDSPDSSTDDPGGPIGDMKAMRVNAQEGLVDIGPRSYEEVEVVDSGEALDIFFWDRIEECTGVDHAHLTYEADRVTVNLFTGRNPEAEVCTEQAVYKVFKVDLAQPLDGRKLADGAS